MTHHAQTKRVTAGHEGSVRLLLRRSGQAPGSDIPTAVMKHLLGQLDDVNQPGPVECPAEDTRTGSLEQQTDSIDGDFDLSGVEEDAALISRCLAGEVKAWEELYARCHPALLWSVKVLLGGGDSDPNMVDEIAARVWYALIDNDGRLLARYDPRRGARAITFLRTVAKTEVRRHFRRERRRQRRERIALRARPAHHPNPDAQTTASLREFLGTLTAGERAFYDDYLGKVDRKPLSANARQLRHRIREKLLRFFAYGP